MTHFVVVGAGQAGASLVARLREDGFDGRITLIGDEPAPPYQRPPLSKGYLLGELARDRLFLRPEAYYADRDITLRTGSPVTAIDPEARTVTLDGETLDYDQLALTTGSVPRRLPEAIGGALNGLYYVRTLADVDAMAEEFRPGRRVLIVGGGYIGLEAAAVAAKQGLEVTLVELADRILQRVAAPETSEYFRTLHAGHGVVIREGIGLAHLTGEDRVSGAKLSDGTTIGADFAIAGTGILPDTRLAEAAGLTCDDGIATDEYGRTSAPGIWAAGDCASFPVNGVRQRLESVPNAIDMADCVARNMMGGDQIYVPEPWFWSDQFDIKLQIAGLNRGFDRVVARGSGEALSHWYYAGDRLLAVDAMNDPRAFMVGKRLLASGRSPDPEQVADPAVDLKSLMR
ncbi:pyridine nucleotide-disulphide oxidoreductase family protein [Pseudooceanicola batsensis HTCC2597]|uniref:Pyridine nucleotide-disulphide oxidoreductase family protein n=1 Tax=Pseudooceanicola batsensis (strain ATCC BAA-863 / DSM 15984 / KCTC 12145 / HTCC2597) TaxID=252305 RepID=A3TVS2_PSEBH|nr:FAD-dependent oxidoreductase [Pseudooceanicola batsensis]EAQ03718.1 pyridine nucleotide-disulphide oxidoreductase family protein [Pseudooceanicola batsensis HTCC2597]